MSISTITEGAEGRKASTLTGMSVAIITGAGGLIGSESARYYAGMGMLVVGVDNDSRARFFGRGASTYPQVERLSRDLGKAFVHYGFDVRDRTAISQLFRAYGKDVAIVVHAAGQPSHDWAATEPFVDFDVNAGGTLAVLEAARRHCPEAAFVHCSTNKVYGDTPNTLPFVELDSRYEVSPEHPYALDGITEDMSIDHSMHSLFGVSKTYADLAVQEYGRYFGLPTVTFRCGTLTGPAHAATEAHGFLAYLMRCNVKGERYRVNGFKGKMVRDAIHSRDVINAFEQYRRKPRPGAVYNLGGGRGNSVSHLEAFALAERASGMPMHWEIGQEPRRGDHRWWITSTAVFRRDYPDWEVTTSVPAILSEIAATL